MKSVLFTILLTPIILFSQERNAKQLFEQGFKKYPIQKAKIDYVIAGQASGEETLQFDNYGWRSVKKASMTFELYDIEKERSQHEIIDGEATYRISHIDSTIRKRIDLRWSQDMNISPIQVSESILFSMGGNYVGDSLLLGRPCKVWKFEDRALMELWIWEGIALKRKSRLGSLEIETTAKEIQLQPTIDPKIFSLPAYPFSK